MITIYTDGSCLGNPGKGGWAFRVILDNTFLDNSGYEEKTTNNRMELLAVINAIKELYNLGIIQEDKKEQLKVITDSNYVIKCATKEWKRNKNLDLWEIYDKVSKNVDISFVWVKGHSGDIHNEQVDKLARKSATDQS
jgi:ribonuclease HI